MLFIANVDMKHTIVTCVTHKLNILQKLTLPTFILVLVLEVRYMKEQYCRAFD